MDDIDNELINTLQTQKMIFNKIPQFLRILSLHTCQDTEYILRINYMFY